MFHHPRLRLPLFLIAGLVLTAGACVLPFQFTQSQETAPAPAAASTALPADTPVSAPGLPAWLNVYFTDPNPPDNLGHGIDRFVKEAIDSAQQSIDVTSFDFNLPDLVNALAAAEKRGVKVRVVYDGTNGSLDVNNAAGGGQPFDTIEVLRAARVGLVDGGRSNGLMHDKVVIVDGKILFVGSWNLSYNDTFRNNNNLLRITDPRLIANYQTKFIEMYVNKRFGAQAQFKMPYPSLAIDGVEVENYFAPEDNVMAHLVALVRGAHTSVHFMIFTYTHQGLVDAMIARQKAGLEVEGVIENRCALNGAFSRLVDAKLPVKVDGNKYTMHHKVIILDGNTVITGSFNFTQAADRENDENLIVIHSPALAALYEQEFQKIYGQGQAEVSSGSDCR